MEDVVVILLAFILVLALAYFSTRFFGKKLTGTRNRNLRIIETLPLGVDRYLYLIHAGKKYYLFYSGKKGLELVTEVELEEEPEYIEDSEKTINSFSFKNIFENYSGLSRKSSDTGSDQMEDGSKTSGIISSIKRLQKINGNKE